MATPAPFVFKGAQGLEGSNIDVYYSTHLSSPEPSMHIETNSRKLIKLMEDAGWRLVNVVGSHHQFEHPTLRKKITVPHPKKDLPYGLARAIHKQAGLLKE